MFRRMSSRPVRGAALALGTALALSVMPSGGALAAPAPAGHTTQQSSSDGHAVLTQKPASKQPSARASNADRAVEPSYSSDPTIIAQTEFGHMQVKLTAVGLTPGAEPSNTLTMPDGQKQLLDSPFDLPVDYDGTWVGYLLYSTTTAPVGTYSVTLTEGSTVITTSFEVIAGDSVPSPVQSTFTPATPDWGTFTTTGVTMHSTDFLPGEHVTGTLTYPEGTVEDVIDTEATDQGVVDYSFVGTEALPLGTYTIDLHGPTSRESQATFEVVAGDTPPTAPHLVLSASPSATNLLLFAHEPIFLTASGLKLGDRPTGLLTYPDGHTIDMEFETADTQGLSGYGIGGSREELAGTYTVTVTSATAGTDTVTIEVAPVPVQPPGNPTISFVPDTMRVDDFEYNGMDIESPGWAMYEDIHLDTVFPDGTVKPVKDFWADKSGLFSYNFDKYDVRDSVPGVYTLRMTGEFSGVHTAQYTLTEVPYEDLVTLDVAASITPQTWLDEGLTVTVRNYDVDADVYFNLMAPDSDEWEEVDVIWTDADGGATSVITLTPEEAATLPLGTWKVKAFDDTGEHTKTVAFDVVAESAGAPTLKVTAAPVVVGHAGAVKVALQTVSGVVPTGTVTLSKGAKALGVATLKNGRATIGAGKLPVGSHQLTVRYSGSDTVDAATKTVVLVVRKAPSTVTATAAPVVVGHQGLVSIAVRTAGDATGKVVVTEGGKKVGTVVLKKGKAVLVIAAKKLDAGTHTLTLRYAGSKTAAADVAKVKLVVRKA